MKFRIPGDTFGLEQTVSPEEYLSIDMNKKVITYITFCPLIKNSYYLRTYKVNTWGLPNWD
jgi:hypothetical protein